MTCIIYFIKELDDTLEDLDDNSEDLDDNSEDLDDSFGASRGPLLGEKKITRLFFKCR